MKILLMKLLLAGVFAVLLLNAGKEILYPVATVMLGGLISSALLDFFKNPTALLFVQRQADAKKVHKTWNSGQCDDDDHGLPPSGIVEIDHTRDKHACPISMCDDGMVAVIDS